MFSNEDRCVYQLNPLGEVICQLRFPQILSIEADLPAKFQDAIRSEYPLFSQRMEAGAPKISGAPGNMSLENQPKTRNYQFASEDGVWRVNLTSRFISLATSRYTSWEEFAAKLDKPLASFIKIYKPAFFERVGLRYLNFISRSALGLEGTPFSELIAPCYLGILSCDDIAESACTRSSVDTELSIRGGCKAKIHAGPGLVQRNGQKDSEVKFIFDQDLYMPGKVPINLSAPCLQTLHGQAYSIFRGAITDILHRAMEPDTL
ncbi:MAG: TIGR04255 family protein [Oscillospiraceae bacterium]|nr:TIGR04255 family protein [Oscillospiraceae bacterium]